MVLAFHYHLTCTHFSLSVKKKCFSEQQLYYNHKDHCRRTLVSRTATLTTVYNKISVATQSKLCLNLFTLNKLSQALTGNFCPPASIRLQFLNRTWGAKEMLLFLLDKIDICFDTDPLHISSNWETT